MGGSTVSKKKRSFTLAASACLLVLLSLALVAGSRARALLRDYKIEEYARETKIIPPGQAQLLFDELRDHFPGVSPALVLANLSHSNAINADVHVSPRKYMFLRKHVLDFYFRRWITPERNLVLVLDKTRPTSRTCIDSATGLRAKWDREGCLNNDEMRALLRCALDSVGSATRLDRN